MEIINEIKMELGKADIPPLVDAVQGEDCTRKLRFALTYHGEAWDIPSGVTAAVNYQKPDGKGGIYDKLPDDTAAYSISGNTVTVTLAPQTLTVHGLTKLTVSLIQGKKLLSTFVVHLQVHYNPGAALAASENFVRYSGFLASSGWTHNAYLGTDASGNVVVKTPDATLSHSGQAADAKATGEAIYGVQQTANEACRVADDAQAVAQTAQENASAAQEAAESIKNTALYASQRAEDAYRIADEAGLRGQDLELRVEKLENNGVGTPGADGASAYEIAVEQGFEGSETEWLESLKGEKGDPGERGIPGESGAKGEKGETGAQGPRGEKGDKGDKGESGTAGTNGKDGYTPVKGTDYYTEADKQEMVELVLAALPDAAEGVY